MRTMTRTASAILFAMSASTAYSACVQVQGLVTSAPDPLCQISSAVERWPSSTSEAADPMLPQTDPAAVCFTIEGTGIARFSGSSGLTSVAVAGLYGRTATPLGFPEPAGGVRSTLTGFTSQAVLTGVVGIGRKKKSGTLYTKDTGTITSDGKVGQILKIVGGAGDFVGASGTIAVAGQEVNGFAIYTGEICTGN